MPTWARLMIGIASARTVIALSLYLSEGAVGPNRQPMPLWSYVGLAATFTLLGLGLVAGNRRDVRAAWLGGIFVLTASPLVAPLLGALRDDSIRWLINVRPEAFQGLFLWYFVARFPEGLNRALPVRVAQIVAGLVGGACALANLAVVWLPLEDAPSWFLPLIATSRPGLYWPLTFGVTVPAFVVMVWRARTTTTADRLRVRRFVGALLIGLMPFAIEVIVEQLWPSYRRFAHQATVEPWIGAILFGALATVPFSAAYSVLFDRVVEVRVVLRAALQYALTRYTVIAFTMVPFGALVVLLIRERDEPLASLVVQGPRAVLLGAFVVLGLSALRLRVQWLHAIDRRYFRESYDADQILTRLVGELSLPLTTPTELCRRVSAEINRAFHADVEVFLVDESRTRLRHVDDRIPSLPLVATLAELAVADSRPMDVDLINRASPLRRLPAAEQQWLKQADVRLLVPMRGARGEPDGLLTLTPKRSGVEYTAADRRLLYAIASAVGLALDSLRLRRSSDTRTDPPAQECRECSRLSDFDTKRCPCGGELAVAAVPHRLRGIFQLERRIGAGGMGVVYMAVDLNLNRPVAIKALPRATPEHMARLRREARAMAAVSHPNLATIYGMETWQDVPFIVQEYVAGGTLANRLNESRLSIQQTLDLGITLATCLEHLHANRMVHCDIKPSNIGFSASGIVKLLDFGLVRLLREVSSAPDGAPAVRFDVPTVNAATTIEETAGPFGTPQFMAPEALRGEPPTPMFDLWALAVVLFECVCGTRPFEGVGEILSGAPVDVGRFPPDVPPELATFFANALAHDSVKRPRDAASFTMSLKDLQKLHC